MITKKDCLEQVREVIDGVLSTVDENGNSDAFNFVLAFLQNPCLI